MHYLFRCGLCGWLVLQSVNSNGQQANRKPEFVHYQLAMNKRLTFQENVENGLQALTYSKAARNDSLVSMSHIQLGILYWHDGQFDSARHHLVAGEKVALKRADMKRVAQCYHYLGLVQYYQCNFEDALAWYKKAEGEFEKLEIDSAVAKLKSHKALIYSVTGQYELAIQNTLESFRMQESSPGYRDMSIPIQFSSTTDERLYYESKLQKDLESLDFVSGSLDTLKMAFTFQNLGHDYSYLKDFASALKYYKESTRLYASLKHTTLSGGIANSFAGLGQYDSAIFYQLKWIDEIQQRGTRIYLTSALANLAACYRATGDWKKAFTNFELAKTLNAEIGLRRSEATMGKALAQLHLAGGSVSDALIEIERSLSIAVAIGCMKDIQEFLDVKSDILMKLGRDKEAAASLKQSRILQDSISQGEGQLQVARLQIEYESDKKSRDLADLQSQNILKEKEIESRTLQIALSFSLLTIVGIAGGFSHYRYRQKKKSGELLSVQNRLIQSQNEELQFQNKEKGVLLSEIHHRVKNNLQIISSLINLKAVKTSPETKEALNQLNGRIFSMGLIHEKLYKKSEIQVIQLDTYLVELARYILDSFEETSKKVELKVACKPVLIDVEPTLTCGLIVNELLTNAMKYAFTEDQKNRAITLCLEGNSEAITLSVADNGQAASSLPENFDKTFGYRFVDQLVSTKLKGEWKVKVDGGYRVIIKFKLNGHSKD